MITPETIERIRDSANLADVIGQSVKLERKGRSLTGLCPFHKEKSPSFNVNEERGFYHCFGCKASGDVFKFVQETEGLSFIEAVKSLGERLGIEVNDDLSSEERRKQSAQKRQEQSLYEVNASAATFFESMLQKHPGGKIAALELERRDLPMGGPAKDVLKSFRIGYAPDSWDELSDHLKKSGHDLRAAEAVGLIAPRRGGQGFYDRFRHRLMFAVVDLHGRVVAFSGRILPSENPPDGDPPAKYINSPESPIYRKRATVFGLYQARDALRSGKPCVMVEGNFDVVSLHARGMTQTVAPLGTAFTVEQGKLIRRFTNQLVLLFDGDTAGRKAAATSREPAKESGLSVRVAKLPDGVDPDDFSRDKGAEGLTHLLSSARGMLDYLIGEILNENFAAQDAEGQARKVEEIVALLRAEDDPNIVALAEQNADRLAGRLGVVDARTFRALRANIRKQVLSAKAARENSGDIGYREPQRPAPKRSSPLTDAILGTLLDFPDLLKEEAVSSYFGYMEGDLALSVATLRETVEGDDVGRAEAGARLRSALSQLPPGVREKAGHRLAAPLHDDIEQARVELFGNLDKLHQMELNRLSTSTLSEIERARAEGDFEKELTLLQEQERRARQRRGL